MHPSFFLLLQIIIMHFSNFRVLKWGTIEMKKQTSKIIFFSTLFCITIAVFLWAFFIGYWNKVPETIHVRVGEEEKIDLGVPITGTLHASSEEIMPVTVQTKQRVKIPVRFNETVILKADRVNKYQIDSKLFGLIPYKKIDVNVIENTRVIPAGIPIGIYVKTKGALVVGIGNFEANYGRIVEPAKYKLQSGDYILAVDGVEVKGKKDLTEMIESSEGKMLSLRVLRNEEEIDVEVQPVLAQMGTYRIGVWIRDNAQGIGTLTFVDESGGFGALGHGINDLDTSMLMNLSAGAMYQTSIIGVRRGEQGNPGELTGYISYDDEHKMGHILKNTGAGIFGVCDETLKDQLIEGSLPIALKQEIVKGPAQIICAVTGEPKYYDVEIVDIRMDSENINRGIVLEVTDPELLELSGGIIQGMSGSPIVQNEKVIGAVTHVFVNDPTRGYGIFIENMLSSAS